jgi:hypothetical protein
MSGLEWDLPNHWKASPMMKNQTAKIKKVILYCTILYYTVLILYWYCTANLKWGVIFKQTF